MSDLAHVTAEDIEAEREPTTPFDICYFLLFENRVVGVLYWDDQTHESVGASPGATPQRPRPVRRMGA